MQEQAFSKRGSTKPINRIVGDSIHLVLNNSSTTFIDFTIANTETYESYTLRIEAGDNFYGNIPVSIGNCNVRVRIEGSGDYYYSDSEGNDSETSGAFIILSELNISDYYAFQIEDYQ